MLSEADFLMLDEPTNKLDIPSAEVLEDALSKFEGCVDHLGRSVLVRASGGPGGGVGRGAVTAYLGGV
jgi:ABC-type enterochelin transport system ATPase subunit